MVEMDNLLIGGVLDGFFEIVVIGLDNYMISWDNGVLMSVFYEGFLVGWYVVVVIFLEMGCFVIVSFYVESCLWFVVRIEFYFIFIIIFVIFGDNGFINIVVYLYGEFFIYYWEGLNGLMLGI